MIGRTYLERGKPVVVLKRWSDGRWAHCQIFTQPGVALFWAGLRRNAPRNVLIRRADGERVVRPFRGLRKLPDTRSENTGG